MEAARKLPPSRLSVDEFLAWIPGDGQSWQLVDGEPQAMAPANRSHSMIQSEFARLIGNHLLERSMPCSVGVDPGIVPRVQSRSNVRIPDIAVTCTLAQSEEPIISEPVLVIEILSPSNHAETWSNVWTYSTIPSVQEILIIRSVSIGADLLRRNPDGTWPERPEAIEAGDVVLDSIGFRAPVAALYRTTHLARSA